MPEGVIHGRLFQLAMHLHDFQLHLGFPLRPVSLMHLAIRQNSCDTLPGFFAAPHERLLPQKLRQRHANAAYILLPRQSALVFMPLSLPTSRRELRHTRAIRIDAYAREDGLWDLDAHITDVKTRDIPAAAGMRPAGVPIHDLWLRITIDRAMNIVDAEAVSDNVPYPGFCDTIGPAYRSMIGLNLMKGLRHELRQRLGGIHGCTHLTELAQILPTAAVQAFAGEVTPVQGDPDKKPFQLDHCHALRTDGAAVAKYYPRWALAHADDSTP